MLSFPKVAVVRVSLYRNRTLTKTTLKQMCYFSILFIYVTEPCSWLTIPGKYLLHSQQREKTQTNSWERKDKVRVQSQSRDKNPLTFPSGCHFCKWGNVTGSLPSRWKDTKSSQNCLLPLSTWPAWAEGQNKAMQTLCCIQSRWVKGGKTFFLISF